MFAKVHSAQTALLQAQIISVEVDVAKGLHTFSIIGLPDKAVEEAKDRVAAAVKNSGFPSPKHSNQKVVVSLAPADLKKEGSAFDVAVALSYLLAVEAISFPVEGKLFLGELSLDGGLRPIKGALPIAQAAKANGFSEIFLPHENAAEAAVLQGLTVFGANTLSEIVDHLTSDNEEVKDGKKGVARLKRQVRTEIIHSDRAPEIDFASVVGQAAAKRGLEIAAAGGHNIAMYGPPGTGKSMLAKAFVGILPPLSFDEILEVTGIHSVSGMLDGPYLTTPPFRSPHHTASYTALVGGGTIPKPGEITLAHRGVLFLDEFPEFERRVIDALRQPLEDKVVSVSRVKGSARFPAEVILIAALNPCPCGNWGVAKKSCVCSPVNVNRYQRKIAGPIADRIDLWVEVANVDYEKLGRQEASGDKSSEIRNRVSAARDRQRKRSQNCNIKAKTNSGVSAKDLAKVAPLSKEVQKTLNQSAEKLDLSARSYHRVVKLARTIADLEGSEELTVPHILEALQYRPKVRNL
jgi:magnesium chelatase family protein